MGFNIKLVKKLKLSLAPRIIQKEFSKKIYEFIDKEILVLIGKGISPVEGKGRYVEYSDSYKKQIRGSSNELRRIASGRGGSVDVKGNDLFKGKRIRPVNLKLSGGMLNSIFKKKTLKSVIVGFKSKLATIHDQLGAGKSRVIRRILPNPQDDESFSRAINIRIRDALKQSVQKVTKK